MSKNNGALAYIESGLYECLKIGAHEVIFDSVYTDNNPELLIEISKDLCKNLETPTPLGR